MSKFKVLVVILIVLSAVTVGNIVYLVTFATGPAQLSQSILQVHPLSGNSRSIMELNSDFTFFSKIEIDGFTLKITLDNSQEIIAEYDEYTLFFAEDKTSFPIFNLEVGEFKEALNKRYLEVAYEVASPLNTLSSYKYLKSITLYNEVSN